MAIVPVGRFSYNILKALKQAKRPMNRLGIAKQLRDAGFAPPVKPLLPILTKLEAAGVVTPGPTTYTPTGRPIMTWQYNRGAQFRFNAKKAIAE